ncbi:MAG: hypothetical protein J6W00_02405 [Lentisphaeria bacterium]|nr:hypothetical protein [Lentisphaeria bacterium]
MIRRILIFIPALFAASIVYAADPAFDVNMLEALRENNPRIRAGLIVGALENSKDQQCDSTALTILENDFFNGAFDSTLHLRLTHLMKKYPDDRQLLFLASEVAGKYNSCPPELAVLLRDFLGKTDFSSVDDHERKKIHNLLSIADSDLARRKNFRESSLLMNQVLEKNPHSPVLLYAGLIAHIRNMFHIHNTAPQLPGFEKIAADDLWKSSIAAVGRKLENASVKNQYDALTLVLAMKKLDHPQTIDRLKKYAADFPGDQWSNISAEIAMKHHDPELFIPGRNIFNNFRLYIHMRDFSSARKLLRSMPKNLQDNLNLIIKSAGGRHREVVNSITSEKLKMENLIPESFHAVLCSCHFLKDKAATEKMLNFMTGTSGKHDHLQNNVTICNAVGYIAADLNIGLKDAETLIRKAVEAFPETSAFRDSLAWVLYRQKRFAEAEKEIMLAIEYSPAEFSTAVIFLHAAQIKFCMNKISDSRKLLEKAKALYQQDKPECAEYDIEIQKKLETLLK